MLIRIFVFRLFILMCTRLFSTYYNICAFAFLLAFSCSSPSSYICARTCSKNRLGRSKTNFIHTYIYLHT